jgi:hypothetical protein
MPMERRSSILLRAEGRCQVSVLPAHVLPKNSFFVCVSLLRLDPDFLIVLLQTKYTHTIPTSRINEIYPHAQLHTFLVPMMLIVD